MYNVPARTAARRMPLPLLMEEEIQDHHIDMGLNALVVGCTIGAVGALLYYLIDLREAAFGGSPGRLKWVSGVFVFCVVLIS